MRYRKKPVVVDAIQYKRSVHFEKLQDRGLCWESVHDGIMVHTPHIHTLEGIYSVKDGDWIIRGVKGEYYPCKPDIFAMTYEGAEE